MTLRKDGATKTKPRRLGRGLGSLMQTPVPIDPTAAPPSTPTDVSRSGQETDDGLRPVAVERIRPNPYQPRQDFDDEALETLATSIRNAGLMQPVVVRPDGDGYQLVVGERRWRAAKRIGLKTIPAVVRTLDDQTATEWALVENIQREDLNPLERAEAFRRLTDEFGLTHQALADRVGLSRSSVTNFLRLNELDDFTRDSVRQGRLTLGHAKALLSITNLEKRRQLAELTVRQAWSVRALERRAAETAKPATTAPRPGAGRATQHAALGRDISQQLGTKVTVQPGKTKGAGRLVIEFYTLDQFDGLMERLGVTVG